jgi:hypothetical protein
MSEPGTHAAAEGVSDDEMLEQVSRQTDSEHEQAEFFKQESEGTLTDTEAAKIDPDELAE